MGIGETIGTFIGKALKNVHAGEDKLAKHVLDLGDARTLEVTSDAFESHARIPARYTSDGENISPPIHVGAIPSEARELVLLCEDPDAPKTTPFVHWLALKIRPDMSDLAEGAGKGDNGIKHGRNTMFKEAYAGPAPPPGHGAHHYHFQVFALDEPLVVGDHVGRDEVLEKMRGHIVACGDLVGVYERA